MLLAVGLDAQSYRVTVVGPVGSEATAINEAGQVAGAQVNTIPIPFGSDAFVWTPVPVPSRGLDQGAHVLPNLGGNNHRATGINDGLQVVGWSESSILNPSGFPVSAGFLWDAAGLKPLPPVTAGFLSSSALGINNLGQVVGVEGSGFSCRPILWLEEPAYGYPAGANVLSAGPFFDGVLNDINDQGEIVGYVTPACDVVAGNISMWLPAPAYGLPVGVNLLSPVAEPVSEGRAINDQGLIVGVWNDFLAGKEQRPVFWNGAGIEFLSSPPLVFSSAHAVNNQGTILGNIGPEPVIWVAGEPTEINTLLPQDSSWRIVRGNDINDREQIAGVGVLDGERYAVVLSPFAFVQFFADGFESGDLSGWDLTFP